MRDSSQIFPLRRAVLLSMAILALLNSSLSLADYKEDYTKGMKAAAEGDWSKVRERMNSALADKADAGDKVRLTGMRFEKYVPKYYLGLAAFKTGDCTGAMRYWNDGATSAIVMADSVMSGMIQAGMSECKTKLAGSSSSSNNALSPSSNTSNAVKSNTNSPPVAINTTAPPKPPIAPIKTTPTISQPVAIPPNTTAAASVAPALLTILDDYLRGRFENASRVSVDAVSDRRAKFHALILRAAAKHRLALRSSNGSTYLDQASADIRAAKTLNTGQLPDPSFYSPGFRNLFASVR